MKLILHAGLLKFKITLVKDELSPVCPIECCSRWKQRWWWGYENNFMLGTYLHQISNLTQLQIH